MSSIETQLRDALHLSEPTLDAGRLQRGVERRRGRRTRRRALITVAAIALVVGALALRPQRASRPVPMFAIEILRSASAGELPPDEHLLREAYASYHAGRDAEAQTLLQRLLDEYPGSPHVPEASVGRGDDYFERGDFGRALVYYHRAVSYERSPVRRYALYKTGWAHVNLGEREAAAAAFARASEGGDPRDPVVKEARKELAKLRR
ncbi:MAG: tol-pal system YbgF family protein [Polyangia bacterium]